ncbi:glycoside hydrolase family 28 protein [Phenylobacterium sp.]|jgi:polygalacturonase|uniref:glycoside hydrolase family 28 protein n=1 Tax=Phenylobacterium sp. TaxID=1871053 RepID=UPI002E303F3B|nr:glycoside hydrolase family 28 protein [Phenylobacterium sp.]HEX2559618.1 glycoside hydrolase family 28 protein [Phenylobacterium sp.]
MRLVATLALAAALIAPPALAQSTAADWTMAEAIPSQIEAPRIPRRDFPVAGPADGRADARPAIMAAIAQASRAGGGRVVLGPGVWLSKGPVHLKSRIELHVGAGAMLLFSADTGDYLPVVKTRWEGTEMMGYSPLIYARDVEDVAITGPGVIDGNAQSGFHAWAKAAETDFQRLRKMGFTSVPLAKRVFGRGTRLRPSMIQILGGKRVKLEGYTVRNSPFWVNHLVYVDQAVVRGLNVESMFPNNDGIDVDSSSRVLIEDNVFRTGDDSVVVKSGRDLDGRAIGRPSEYVLVRNNDMGGEDGIALGSEMSGGIRHVFFTDNVLRKGASAIRFKANLDRGGVVEHVRVRRMKVEDFATLFWFQLNYPGELGGNFPATYRDIVFEDFEVQNVGVVFEGRAPAAAPLKGVLLKDVVIASAKTPLVLENVEALRFDGVVIGGQRWDGEVSARAK